MRDRKSRLTNEQQALKTPSVVMLSGRKFVLASGLIAVSVLFIGREVELPVWLLAAEVLANDSRGLLLFGSFKYQRHKNALTYGMALIIVATFCGLIF